MADIVICPAERHIKRYPVPGSDRLVFVDEIDMDIEGVLGAHGLPGNPDDCACTAGTVCRQNSACPRLKGKPVEH